ncbi:MAG: acetyltransferase [Deltaproteobacteria bacterium RIFOXYA12_FULL_58_15]|nr:MAG: acetyltransferase [Deltaproteobacteria bacterium RIFOXYA12_FULL_58_15]OGR14754.1 MAG: acetyltransferase [Deltaproteobacteria bacterium RIFOXYB12_FULL_58_9]
MSNIDIFNGDADGLCALIQLRLVEPRDSALITGVKRDIALVAKANIASGDRVTVLDISFDMNREGVMAALDAGAEIFYVDHHFAGDLPQHDAFMAVIDADSNICTSLLVNQHLKNQYPEWAMTGAFGDNLNTSARQLARDLQLSEERTSLLEKLGTYLNYNGYGASIADLHFSPGELFELMHSYPTPFDFVEDDAGVFAKLESGYCDDMAAAAALKPTHASKTTAVFILPDETWARRVSGVYSNDLANASPERAHAVLTERPDGTYLVSVRAPLDNKQGADALCRKFSTGGGRAAAAGINALPGDQLQAFIDLFVASYP